MFSQNDHQIVQVNKLVWQTEKVLNWKKITLNIIQLKCKANSEIVLKTWNQFETFHSLMFEEQQNWENKSFLRQLRTLINIKRPKEKKKNSHSGSKKILITPSLDVKVHRTKCW